MSLARCYVTRMIHADLIKNSGWQSLARFVLHIQTHLALHFQHSNFSPRLFYEKPLWKIRLLKGAGGWMCQADLPLNKVKVVGGCLPSHTHSSVTGDTSTHLSWDCCPQTPETSHVIMLLASIYVVFAIGHFFKHFNKVWCSKQTIHSGISCCILDLNAELVHCDNNLWACFTCNSGICSPEVAPLLLEHRHKHSENKRQHKLSLLIKSPGFNTVD